MNVYNEAHNLAKAIRESEEFKQYEAAKKSVSNNRVVTDMLNDFQTRQFELQARQLMGEASPDDENEKIQELYSVMMKDPLSAQYLQCEIRFSMMINDVYKILGETAVLGLAGRLKNE